MPPGIRVPLSVRKCVLLQYIHQVLFDEAYALAEVRRQNEHLRKATVNMSDHVSRCVAAAPEQAPLSVFRNSEVIRPVGLCQVDHCRFQLRHVEVRLKASPVYGSACASQLALALHF